MKYPLENTTVWDLIRHPFDEKGKGIGILEQIWSKFQKISLSGI